ncbi:hypothetical protein ABPG72_008538 [Tetrahymena utriculariae]
MNKNKLFDSHNKTQDYEDIQALWSAFKTNLNKKYADPDFEHYRLQVFTENLKIVESNCDNYGITQFMDLTQEEFKEIYLTLEIKDDLEVSSISEFDDADNGNHGCHGGVMDYAFDFINQNGIPTEASSPYKAVKGACKMTSGPYKISSHTDIKSCNDLLDNLQKQPIAQAVDATNFQFYTQGIFSDCGTNLDHGVLLVGYSSSEQYWKIKNSWGTSWSENGYIKFAAGNNCGLCNMASFPTV